MALDDILYGYSGQILEVLPTTPGTPEDLLFGEDYLSISSGMILELTISETFNPVESISILIS